ncbi:MAG: hypothetical protein U9Q78_03205 [Chloroflexota bacterium]|nr:hypothetical protein [Chloroflexota bacterium]
MKEEELVNRLAKLRGRLFFVIGRVRDVQREMEDIIDELGKLIQQSKGQDD